MSRSVFPSRRYLKAVAIIYLVGAAIFGIAAALVIAIIAEPVPIGSLFVSLCIGIVIGAQSHRFAGTASAARRKLAEAAHSLSPHRRDHTRAA